MRLWWCVYGTGFTLKIQVYQTKIQVSPINWIIDWKTWNIAGELGLSLENFWLSVEKARSSAKNVDYREIFQVYMSEKLGFRRKTWIIGRLASIIGWKFKIIGGKLGLLPEKKGISKNHLTFSRCTPLVSITKFLSMLCVTNLVSAHCPVHKEEQWNMIKFKHFLWGYSAYQPDVNYFQVDF